MRQFVLLVLAFACLVIGLAFFVTPIPLGVPLVGLSALLFIAASRNFTRLMLHGRHHSPRLNWMFEYLERHGGTHVRKALRRTRPGRLPKSG